MCDDEIEQFNRELLGYSKGHDSVPPHADYCLNLSESRFISAVAYGAIITADKVHESSRGRAFALCNVPPEIHEVFSITRLDKILDIYEDVNHFLRER